MEKGSSSSASGGGGRAADHSHSHSLNGLNFGKKIYFQGGGGVGSGVLRPRSSGGGRLPEEEEAALPRSPAKKGRSSVEGGQPPRCQVEGCNIDLSGTKAYYCRHKVCGIHSKSSRVIVAGLHQRFCQQCSRFHQLPEFDQGKRSCRRRLAGHNERRRKPPPPPGPFLSSSYTTTLSPPTFDNQSKTGGLVMDFTRREDSWPNNNNTISALKYEQDDEDDDDDDLLEDSTNTRNNTTRHSYCGGAVITSPCPESSSTSKCALSLLSKQSIPTWESTNQALLLQPSLDTTTAAAAQFSWGLKASNHHNQAAANNSTITAAATTFHEMAPPHHMQAQYSRHELGLSQLSEGQYHGLDGPTGYDASLQHMNWSL
ncbi:hypothetical protein ABFX02_11G004900 [Erythranthe guttata]